MRCACCARFRFEVSEHGERGLEDVRGLQVLHIVAVGRAIWVT